MLILQILLTSCHSYNVIKVAVQLNTLPSCAAEDSAQKPQSICRESLFGSAAVWDLGQTLFCHLFSEILLSQYFVLVFQYPTLFHYLATLHLPQLHHISFQVQNVFPILQFCFVCLLHLHQNQISFYVSLPDIFLLDEVTAQLIHFLIFFLIVQLLLFSTIIFPIHFSLEILLNLSKSSEEQTEEVQVYLPSKPIKLSRFSTAFLSSPSCHFEITWEL